MIFPFAALALLAALIPAFTIIDGVWTVGVASIILAPTLMATAIALPAVSLTRLTRLLRPAAILVVAAPAIWMLVQVIPMPALALANPIWGSASAALNQRLADTITVDIGATLLSLAQYFAVVAAALVTGAVTLDRQRATYVLYILVVIAALVAARQIALEVTSFDHASLGHSNGRGAPASVVAVIGILLACATAIRAVDQLQRVGRPRRFATKAVFTLCGAILSLLICMAAILIAVNLAAVTAATFGAGILLTVFVIRRWFLGPWGVAGVAATAAIVLLGSFTVIPFEKNADLTVALSTQSQIATERMLSDVIPVGSGAGAFEALLPVYRDVGAASREYPTAAATIAVEMGRAFLCGVIIVTLFGAYTLFRRSLSRGYDYVYAGVGAGALVSLLIMAFVNGGILDLGASLLTAMLCGLAFAQSLSGRTRNVTSFELHEPPKPADGSPGGSRSALSIFSGKTWPRIAMALYALLLTTQAVWILSAETHSHDRFSIAENAASPAKPDGFSRAASIAMVRGDLWAESAFALVVGPWTNPAAAVDDAGIPEPALSAFTQALHCSPHRGDVWLMLAALADRYRSVKYDIGALLKMSYYTAPNELSLLPLRLHVALAANAAAREPELRDMVKRDIRLVLTRQPALRPALTAAYHSASADGKAVAEHLISEVDPGYLKTMRAQYQ
jgi:hypothetical protein